MGTADPNYDGGWEFAWEHGHLAAEMISDATGYSWELRRGRFTGRHQLDITSDPDAADYFD